MPRTSRDQRCGCRVRTRTCTSSRAPTTATTAWARLPPPHTATCIVGLLRGVVLPHRPELGEDVGIRIIGVAAGVLAAEQIVEVALQPAGVVEDRLIAIFGRLQMDGQGGARAIAMVRLAA